MAGNMTKRGLKGFTEQHKWLSDGLVSVKTKFPVRMHVTERTHPVMHVFPKYLHVEGL